MGKIYMHTLLASQELGERYVLLRRPFRNRGPARWALACFNECFILMEMFLSQI